MRIGIPLLLFLSAIQCFAQTDTTSVYSQALKFYSIHLDNSKHSKTEIFIENNDGITGKLPDHVDTRRVTILTWENREDVYARNNNKLRHVKIYPARIKDDLIEITITPYIGEYKGKKKGYLLSISDWVVIQFKFNCEENRYEYWNTKTGGI